MQHEALHLLQLVMGINLGHFLNYFLGLIMYKMQLKNLCMCQHSKTVFLAGNFRMGSL